MTVLCNTGITAPVTGAVQPPVAGFGAPTSCTFEADFTYVAASGSTVVAYVQTSLDAGATWWDVAAFQFATSSGQLYQNCANSPVNQSVALGQQALTANTGINGFLGDRFRVVLVSSGTYGSGTAVTVKAFPRY